MNNLQLIPKISEKALQSVGNKVYVFFVPRDASKDQIAKAVSEQYDVSVKAVRTVVVKGKKKSSMRKRLQPIDGRRATKKKAYITLSKGEIKILEDSA